MEEPTSESQTKQTPAWLKHLQENSWEAEILISGGAIFSLFQVVNYLIASSEQVTEAMPFTGHQEILMILVLVLRGVAIGFLCHLFLRGFWIALVCLQSTYPDGINFSRLRIQGRYLAQSGKINLTDQIISLDNVSGLIFFSSFLFMLVLTGFMILFVVSLYIVIFITPDYLEFSFIHASFIVLLLVYLLDLMTGLLRRNRIIGNLFLPIYWYFNLLSLGFLYRPYLQIISTNIIRWKAALFMLFVFLSSGTLTFISLQGHNNWKNPFDQRTFSRTGKEIFMTDEFYRDRMTNEARIRYASIQSELIQDDYLMLFIPSKAKYADAVAWSEKKIFTEIISISINDSTLNQVEWFSDVRKGQPGVAANVSIIQLPKGKNVLGVQVNGQRFYLGKDKLEILFWKE